MKRLLFLLLLIPVLSFGQEVYTYGGDVVTYSGDVVTKSYPNVLVDGNTVAWYIADDLTTITKDGSDFVSRWNDYLGSGRDLLQAAVGAHPLWSADGILFDGTTDFMKAVAFTYEQPEMIYIVFKQVTWTSVDYFFDGNASNSGIVYQAGVTPQIVAYAGSASTNNGNLALDTWGIVRVLFDGAASKLIVNETAATTGNFGVNDMGGFTLGTKGAGSSGNTANIQVKEIILRKISDSAGDEADIYAYLKAKYELAINPLTTLLLLLLLAFKRNRKNLKSL